MALSPTGVVMEIKTDTMSAEAADPQKYPMCGFLDKPFPECYCLHMSSRNIPKILKFCAGEFQSCLIYRHHIHMVPSWPDAHTSAMRPRNI